MIIQCTNTKQVSQILEYINKFKMNTPYIYLNVKRYGVSLPQMKVWVDEIDENIAGVYVKYYDCLHFFSKEGSLYPLQSFTEIVNSEKPKVVMTQDAIGERIQNQLSEKYQLRRNILFNLQVSNNSLQCSEVKAANRSDISDIAELMMSDREFNEVYQKNSLIAQLMDRYVDQFSRYFVIRRDGRIAAFYSTYGEAKDLAILSGLFVHPQYRRRGLANEVIRHALFTLQQENKEAVTFVNQSNTSSLNLHRKIGAKPISIMYKFVSNNKS